MADVSLVAVGATTCALSAVFGWIAIKVQLEHRRWCARGLKVEGVVTRLSERPGRGGFSSSEGGMDSESGILVVPIVGFQAANGFRYEIDAPEAPIEIGSVVEVAYDPALPSGGRAVARVPKIGCAVILFVIGVFLVLVGISR